MARSREGLSITDGIDFGASFLEDVRAIDESGGAELSVLAYRDGAKTKAETDLRHDARQDAEQLALDRIELAVGL